MRRRVISRRKQFQKQMTSSTTVTASRRRERWSASGFSPIKHRPNRQLTPLLPHTLHLFCTPRHLQLLLAHEIEDLELHVVSARREVLLPALLVCLDGLEPPLRIDRRAFNLEHDRAQAIVALLARWRAEAASCTRMRPAPFGLAERNYFLDVSIYLHHRLVVLKQIAQELLLVREELLLLDNVLQLLLPRLLPHRLDGSDVFGEARQLRMDGIHVLLDRFEIQRIRRYMAF